ncbi:HAMP domain-containing sensor histidine kinase [Paractinoplanes ferrugineus]|uniref:Signal transduction histidine-protein kinase/phosphatase MprB n=1 Tax=Paractinoplanes ferrugineus TaxID=113564 RepID=A0A919J728_9ACTN|nr:HAMP domain-containing sensor histidine kinase [Actinoplanes ferrugineus]GIE15263.1 two-component sensor histidine kinase [Actinoplanes ferrugineus]
MRSLLVRLLAALAVVSICSIAATAWLAVRTTTRAIRQEQAQALTDDARVYDTLLGYAAGHRSWSGVAPVVRSLAGSTGHRVALTSTDGSPIADSGVGALPAHPSATVNPLQNLESRIDPRAVGPFLLPPVERAALAQLATQVLDCLRGTPAGGGRDALPEDGVIRDARIVVGPSGRPWVQTPGADLAGDVTCLRARDALAVPTPTERNGITALEKEVNDCMRPRYAARVRMSTDFTWRWDDPGNVRGGLGLDTAVDRCVDRARRSQLAAWTAPPALLYLTAPGIAEPVTGLDLSPANRARIIGVSGLVLLITVVVGALVGRRLIRPLRELTAAAGHMRDGDDTTRVAVTGSDEIARLGAAFNDMAARRQQAEKLRRDMVGDIAHEMRTPVTNIRGWLEAAEDGVAVLDDKLIASLLEEALLLQHVIDDLQDLSAADAGELRLRPAPVDVAELLTQIAASFGTPAVDVVVDTPPGLTLTADPVRLRQAVGNLTGNAVRHSPPGGTVHLAAVPAGAEVLISVTDEGTGIAAEHLPLVFERFWRAEKSRNRRTGGSGLGLAITRKLTEAHGGSVGVASPPGRGATFTLRLPAGEAHLTPSSWDHDGAHTPS